jgi:hypothetical protein
VSLCSAPPLISPIVSELAARGEEAGPTERHTTGRVRRASQEPLPAAAECVPRNLERYGDVRESESWRTTELPSH